MTLVVDASVVIAALTGDDLTASWADRQLAADDLIAPSLLPIEVLGQLRRAVAGARISPDRAALSAADLGDLPIAYHPPVAFLDRIWALRDNVTPYDAWYVALAEVLDAPLATLDQRLARASGPRCRFVTP